MEHSVLILSEQYLLTVKTTDQSIHQTVTTWLVKELHNHSTEQLRLEGGVTNPLCDLYTAE